MNRLVVLALAALLAAGCVSSDDPANGAVRVLHAVPDAPRMSLYIDDILRSSGFDYRSGSAYFALAAGAHQVEINELLPSGSDPTVRTVYRQPVGLSVNDEVTLVVVGEAASQTEEVLWISTTTRGVPTGRTRLQVLHAGVGAGPVDVYVIAPDALVSASTPFATALAYKSWTGQSEIAAGNARIVVTPAGDAGDVLLETGTLFLPLEGTLLVAVVNNPGLDSAARPFNLTLLSGSGSAVVSDKDSPSNLRLVNASPGSYTLDAFVNATAADDTARQACDPLSTEDGVFLEQCALPYETVGAYQALEPSGYEIKVQQSDPATVTAKSFSATLAATTELTVLLTGLVPDTATATDVTLQSLLATRRVATAAQLRLVDASVAGDAAVAGDPGTDRLEVFITAACADLADESPDYVGLSRGSDTGYVSYLGGDYQLTVTRTDTASGAGDPEVLLSKRVSLAEGGIYTLLIADSAGGVQPLKYLSLDDDPALADCPAPP